MKTIYRKLASYFRGQESNIAITKVFGVCKFIEFIKKSGISTGNREISSVQWVPRIGVMACSEGGCAGVFTGWVC